MSVARNETNKLTYLERYFEIHGELEGIVYRTKRNGEQKANWEKQAESIWRKYGNKLKHPRFTGFNIYTREYLAGFQ